MTIARNWGGGGGGLPLPKFFGPFLKQVEVSKKCHSCKKVVFMAASPKYCLFQVDPECNGDG